MKPTFRPVVATENEKALKAQADDLEQRLNRIEPLVLAKPETLVAQAEQELNEIRKEAGGTCGGSRC